MSSFTLPILLLGAVAVAAQSASSQTLAPAAVPAAYQNSFGNASTGLPLANSPCRYQQVFSGSELPAALPTKGLGLRFDERSSNVPGATVELEIRLGYTTKDASSLGNDFAANFDVTTPPPVLVLPRTKFQLLDMPSTPSTNPQIWQIQIPFRQPFVWVQQTGRNLLVEIVVHGNSNGNTSFKYAFDSCTGTGATTSYVYAANPTATIGSVTRTVGLVVALLDRIRPTGQFVPFGQGCPGTGGKPGVVLPAAAKAAMGNYNNYYGVGAANQRYHQIHDGAQVGPPRNFIGHALRFRAASQTGGAQTLEIKLAPTTVAPASMSSSFSANITSAQTTVFQTKTYVYPAMVPNSDPAQFDIDFKWDKPFTWTAQPNQHLLIEVLNHSTSGHTYTVDAMQNDPSVSRMWGTGVTATSGSVRLGQGLILRLHYAGSGSDVPRISSTGRPVLNQSYTVDLHAAKASTAAILVFGVSDSTWSGIPLPWELTALGAQGCRLLVSFDAFFGAATDAAGDASLNFTMPNISAFAGLSWFHQFLVLDTGANSLGFAFSDAAKATLGEQ